MDEDDWFCGEEEQEEPPEEPEEAEEDPLLCILCGLPYEGYGHNPSPLRKHGRCCLKCNWDKVIPARLCNKYHIPPEMAKLLQKYDWRDVALRLDLDTEK